MSSVLMRGDELYAGTSAGIFRSDNNGANWSQIISGLVQTLSYKDNLLFAGAGYAGGIISAALDGQNAAKAIVRKNNI